MRHPSSPRLHSAHPRPAASPPGADAPPGPDTPAAARPRPRGWAGRQRQNLALWFSRNTFAPDWLPEHLRHVSVGYLAAVLLEIVTTIIDVPLAHLFSPFPFLGLLVVLMVVLVALSWGAGPAIVASVTGALLVNIILLPPSFSFSIKAPGEIAGPILIFLVGLAVSVIASQTEHARRLASAERANLEALFEALSDGLLAQDQSGAILRTNKAVRDLLALDADPEYATRPATERKRLLNPRNEQGEPLADEDWPTFTLLNGAIIQGNSAMDMTVRNLAGREVRINVTGAPVRNLRGQIAGAVLLMRDVTERRQLEQRTQHALEALLAMAETLAQVPGESAVSGQLASTLTSDTAQRLVELTRRVLGCQRVTITAHEPETGRQLPVAAVGLSLEQQHFWDSEQHNIRLSDGPDPTYATRLLAGEVVLVDMSQAPYRDWPNPYAIQTMLAAPMRVGEQLVGVLGLDYGSVVHTFTPEEIVLADAASKLGALVLERERLLREREVARANELALREANRRMDAFLGIASHELKTPLTSTRASIQLLRRRMQRLITEETRANAEITRRLEALGELLTRTERQTGLLNRLVDDLLDVSRIQAERLELHKQPTDLSAIVSEMVQQQGELAPTRTLRLHLVPGQRALILADADRIGQVLTNYLTNALKYSQEDQPVEVGLELEGASVRVWVRDQGPGLPAEEQAHIWERFHRVKGIEVQSGSGVGLGIGLFISRTIIERHQGQVGVESAPGQGSTFWFRLPLAEEQL